MSCALVHLATTLLTDGENAEAADLLQAFDLLWTLYKSTTDRNDGVEQRDKTGRPVRQTRSVELS